MGLDRKFGINISLGKHGLLRNDRNQVAGAVLFLNRSQARLLRSKGWIIQGTNPLVKSAWAPSRCVELRSGGWKPSVTVSRTCMTIAVIDSRFGIVRDAGGTTNGLIIPHGKIIGAVVHLDTPNKRSILERKHWAWNGENPTIKSIFAPQWCIPLKMS